MSNPFLILSSAEHSTQKNWKSLSRSYSAQNKAQDAVSRGSAYLSGRKKPCANIIASFFLAVALAQCREMIVSPSQLIQETRKYEDICFAMQGLQQG
ncbi:hypothetical protein CEXT_221111 [Caerostris extrusa]|uniref:Uncharacterized protein n=1 Tax=Caerostris extrusa TaxID=172846 RepID=A0AAV4MF03_CAEEX|nr:hypothetical protein CEXT_221111 [Caerostris extrusa]